MFGNGMGKSQTAVGAGDERFSKPEKHPLLHLRRPYLAQAVGAISGKHSGPFFNHRTNQGVCKERDGGTGSPGITQYCGPA